MEILNMRSKNNRITNTKVHKILFLLLLLEKSQNWELHPLIDGARSKPTSTPTIPSPYMSPLG